MATFAKQMINGIMGGSSTATVSPEAETAAKPAAKPAPRVRPTKPANRIVPPKKAASGGAIQKKRGEKAATAAAASLPKAKAKAKAKAKPKAEAKASVVKAESAPPEVVVKTEGGAPPAAKAPAKASKAASKASNALVPASTAVVPSSKPQRSPIAKARRAQSQAHASSQAFVAMSKAGQERTRDLYKAAAFFYRRGNHSLLRSRQKGARRMKLIDNSSFVVLGHCAALETFHDLACRSLAMGTLVHKERSTAPFQPVITRDAITAMTLELLRYVQSAAAIAADHNERACADEDGGKATNGGGGQRVTAQQMSNAFAQVNRQYGLNA